jgi:ABC-type multidrug transport system fused ATPase/permease subunit
MGRELRHLGSTLRLLYQVDRSAFLIGTTASVLESVAYPLMLLVVWRGLDLVLAQTKPENLVSRGMVLLGVLFGLLALETVLRMVTDAATSLLQAESAQQVNGRIMHKMAEVPYHLFEDNDFQARYGLLIAQASHQPGQLVQAFIGGLGALISSLAIAATLLAFAPILVLFLLVLFPLTAAEARYHRQMVELQTTASPALFRMMYLAQRSIDATWQRDIRVHRSTILDDEYRFLSSRYLSELRALLRRYQFIRTAVGLGAAAVMTLAVGAVFWVVGGSPGGPAEAAILLPALVMGLGQGRSFATSWGAITECLGYLAQLFDFLNHRFEQPRATHEQTSRAAAAPTVA